MATAAKALGTGYLSTLGISNPETRYGVYDLQHPQGEIARPNWSSNSSHTIPRPGVHDSLSNRQLATHYNINKTTAIGLSTILEKH